MTQGKTVVDFKVFLIVWNRLQGQGTPALHRRMADWLQGCWRAGDTRLLLMAFRSSGKSTIVGLFAAWLLYANPDLRIMVLAAEGTLAQRMVRNVRRVIERHPLTAGLRPDHPDQWAGERFTVNRRLELREASMAGLGVEANITGSRADVIICDDVEVPNTCDTAEKRLGLREVLADLDYILVPGGTLLYVGTPHHWYTIYADRARNEIGEVRPFLSGYCRLVLPVLDERGCSQWPERFSQAEIDRRKAQGLNRFRSQMMLEPVNVAEGRLQPERLRRYSGEVRYIRELNRLDLQGKALCSCSAFWDPAFGQRDRSVLALVYGDEDGALWLHRVLYLKSGQEPDEATGQARQVVAVARDFMIPSVTLESNGIGKFLPLILRRELALSRIPCAVVDHHNSRSKDERILEAFETVMAAGMLHVHESVYATPFITEMQEWRPGRSGGHDDGLDAVAGALLRQPARLPVESFSGRHSWHGYPTHTARTDFDV
ncbi:MAG: phage terminase large subunit [Micavibrio aeruginosavorus]|uniref:Phage terminase large subunit n=1 Tax=Micavibrio aeruginosavorus TaxID=349221 RepID=A0A7T5R221_9BACT|nr:MAG: phage terminase large subunit [Micavibrio aeruginosavorus]